MVELSYFIVDIGVITLIITILTLIYLVCKLSKAKVSLIIDDRLFSDIKYKKHNKILLPWKYSRKLSSEDQIILISKFGQMKETLPKYVKSTKVYDNIDHFINSHGWRILYPRDFSSFNQCKEFYVKILSKDNPEYTEAFTIVELTLYN